MKRIIVENMRDGFLAILLLALFAVLTGCASKMDLPKPTSTAESVMREAIVAQKTANAVNEAVTELLERRVIGSKTAEDIGAKADVVAYSAAQARHLLNVDWNNTAGAAAYLQVADAALQALDRFLTSHGKEVPK